MKVQVTRHSVCPMGPTMSRAQFLRAVGVGAVAIGGGGYLASAVHAGANIGAGAAEVDVYPTGSFPFDLDEVGAAVNGGVGPSGRDYPGGGIVRLKATNVLGTPMFFNFGGGLYPSGRGSLMIKKDVTIVGDMTGEVPMTFPNGHIPDDDFTPDRTVVYGGKRAFNCSYQANPVPTTLTVRNIYFAFPSLAGIQVSRSAGLEVSDCVIYDVQWDDTTAGFWIAVGIEATGIFQASPELFGDFRIMNNRIRRAAPTTSPMNFFPADSGVVMNFASMEGLILGNQIDRFPFGVAIDRSKGRVMVAANTVSRCGYGANPMAAGIGARGTSVPVTIERNQVIGGQAGAAIWSKNAMSLASSNVIVRSNTVEGTTQINGILLTTFAASATGPTYAATNNTIEKNRLTELVPGRSQAYVSPTCDANRFANNNYGAVAAGGLAGVVVHANANQFVNEHFWGVYPGFQATPSLPCMWLTEGSQGNAVSALKYDGAPQGKDVCTQVLDQGANDVRGAERC